MRIVERRDIVLATLDEPIVGGQDTRYRGHEDGVCGHEPHKGLCGSQDDPRTQGPAAKEGDKNHAATDVEPLGRYGSYVVGEGNTVGTNVDTDLCKEPDERTEEGSRSPTRVILPFVDDINWVPKRLPINLLGSPCGDNTKDANNRFEEGNCWKLPEICTFCFAESREVGNVDCQCSVTPVTDVYISDIRDNKVTRSASSRG